MEYHEAADIARKHPGAVLTRDAAGTFVVRLPSGAVIASSNNADTVVDTVHREREERPGESSRVPPESVLWEEQLRHEIADLNGTIATLKGAVSAARWEVHQLSQEGETLRAENASLQTKISKVSAEEWERIKKADKVVREADIAHRKSDRHSIKCACLGEVENCVRCFGAGEYIVDGFGNRV